MSAPALIITIPIEGRAYAFLDCVSLDGPHQADREARKPCL